MKILLIIPGSGDAFYCGNCFRDSLYAQALRRAEHDVVVMPLYLPFTDQSFLADTPLFFPATSYYVAQKFFNKGRMPHWLEKALNIPLFLRLASRFSGSTSAKGMEDMTLSMIKGDDPNFKEQTGKIIDWMEQHECPDIVHLSTSMLIGIAKAIKHRMDIPVVCTLQDEEVWLDSLEQHHAKQAWQAIGENAKYVDKFITSSDYYKSYAQSKYPEIQDIEAVYPGVDVEAYASSDYPEHPTIGFHYRLNYENGLDILAKAFVKLKKENSIPNLKLKIGGGYTRENKRLVQQVIDTLKPFWEDVIWSNDYALNQHTAFYKSISVICTPLRFNEAFGLYLSEAFAAGRPAVVPNTGSFGEVTQNAGLFYFPNNSDHLADALREILTKPIIYDVCKENALQLSHERYNDAVVGQKLATIYSKLLAV
ncbi:MAG: glycosyltransferase family 4 protein [Bacteroidales bacterium]|jgi:glycosyltransferase involved in cell wall biosynthesis|nr:glycosyltransferase family 4 protein [Bacteroidales bacterium]